MTKAKQIFSDAAPRGAPLPSLLSVEAVAIELSVCTKTVRRLLARGALPTCRVGRLLRVKRADLEHYIAFCTDR